MADERIICRLPAHPPYNGELVQLLRALYGLKLSPKKWWTEFNNFLTKEAGWSQVGTEPSLYYKDIYDPSTRSSKRAYLSVYVDDFIITAHSQAACRKEFEIINRKYKSELGKFTWHPDKPDTKVFDFLG